MNSLLSPSYSPTCLVRDSCRLDKGLIIPWICQALTSPMSPCAWCAVSGASPAENPISSLGWVWICVYLSMVAFKLRRSPYGVLGGLNSPIMWDVILGHGCGMTWECGGLISKGKKQNLLNCPLQQAVQHDWPLVYQSALCFPCVKNERNQNGFSIIKSPLTEN